MARNIWVVASRSSDVLRAASPRRESSRNPHEKVRVIRIFKALPQRAWRPLGGNPVLVPLLMNLKCRWAAVVKKYGV